MPGRDGKVQFANQAAFRPSFEDWLLSGADWAATRAECSRRKVGALIFKDHRVLAQGYNGALPGEVSCLEGGCPRAYSDVEPGSQYEHGPGACIAIHAEPNALLDAARRGIAVGGASMAVNCEPCLTCARLVWTAGIAEIIWSGPLGRVVRMSTPIVS